MLARALTTFPLLSKPTPPSAVLAAPTLAVPEEEEPVLISEDEVQSALLEGILASPIEEWMSFLHPDQAKIVRRNFAGPARIRERRARERRSSAFIAPRTLYALDPAGFCVTTYVRTLPAVLRQNLARMTPEAVDRVDFVGVHKFALDLLKSRRVACTSRQRRRDQVLRRGMA